MTYSKETLNDVTKHVKDVADSYFGGDVERATGEVVLDTAQTYWNRGFIEGKASGFLKGIVASGLVAGLAWGIGRIARGSKKKTSDEE